MTLLEDVFPIIPAANSVFIGTMEPAPALRSQSPPATRAEAKALGLNRYHTGKPCSRGHVVNRWVSTRQCVDCAKAADARRYAADPEKMKARHRNLQLLTPTENLSKGNRFHV